MVASNTNQLRSRPFGCTFDGSSSPARTTPSQRPKCNRAIHRQTGQWTSIIRPDMSDPDQKVSFEQFVAAREQAIALTDRVASTAGDDWTRDELCRHVVRQT